MTLEASFYEALGNQSLWVVGFAYIAGIVSMFLPCSIAMMPILIGYMGGCATTNNKTVVVQQTIMFVLGLSIVFAVLGTLASLLGLTFGSWVGPGWYTAIGLLAIVMALNILNVIHLPMPRFIQKLPEGGADKTGWGRWISPLVMGMAFGLAASPCGTPFLAGILGLISRTQNIALGAVSLMAYALGQGTLLIVIGIFTGLLKNLATLRQMGSIITKLSGAAFLLAGIMLILEGFGWLAPLLKSLGLV